jgi:DNA-binding HxlR family transcriptional regulator
MSIPDIDITPTDKAVMFIGYVLSHKTRLKIIKYLTITAEKYKEGLSFSNIQHSIEKDLRSCNLSFHLGVLQKAGIVSLEKHNQEPVHSRRTNYKLTSFGDDIVALLADLNFIIESRIESDPEAFDRSEGYKDTDKVNIKGKSSDFVVLMTPPKCNDDKIEDIYDVIPS